MINPRRGDNLILHLLNSIIFDLIHTIESNSLCSVDLDQANHNTPVVWEIEINKTDKQEANGPHSSPEKQMQSINTFPLAMIIPNTD